MYLALLALSLGPACGGLSLGEKYAGGDTYLEFGSIAVDDVSEDAFVLAADGQLYGVDIDDGRAEALTDLRGLQDARMLFPEVGPMVMAQFGDTERLQTFDRDTWLEVDNQVLPYRYHGTRMAPSRGWIAAVDNADPALPVHVLDPSDLSVHAWPTNAAYIEAMWANNTDLLLSVIVRCVAPEGCEEVHDPDDTGADSGTYETSGRDSAPADSSPPSDSGDDTGGDSGSGDTGAEPYVSLEGYATEIVAWQLDASGNPFASGTWPAPTIDLTLPDTFADLTGSFTWITVSPDDHFAAFPLVDATRYGAPDAYDLVLVDLTDGTIRTVPGVRGPVGFTPDSSTLVGYSIVGTGEERVEDLVMVDLATLEPTYEGLAAPGELTYFVTHEGNYVVVVSTGDETRPILLVNLDDGTTTALGEGVGLDEFVSRPAANQLWLVENPDLWRLDLGTAKLEAQTLPFVADHINILPERDLLVLDDPEIEELYFVDPDDVTAVQSVALPLAGEEPPVEEEEAEPEKIGRAHV